jgi:UbiD family decarboxylase
MVHNDLRDWIDDLEERNDLKRITAEVDWNEEIGAITREISSQFGPALFFENIKGHRQTLCRRLFTNGTGTRERCAVVRCFGKPRTVSWFHLQRPFCQTSKTHNGEQRTVKETSPGDAVDLFSGSQWNPMRWPFHHDLGECRHQRSRHGCS